MENEMNENTAPVKKPNWLDANSRPILIIGGTATFFAIIGICISEVFIAKADADWFWKDPVIRATADSVVGGLGSGAGTLLGSIYVVFEILRNRIIKNR